MIYYATFDGGKAGESEIRKKTGKATRRWDIHRLVQNESPQ